MPFEEHSPIHNTVIGELEEYNIIVFIAPTGYGKTSLLHHAFQRLQRRWARILHVLPLRALIYDVVSKALKRGIEPDNIAYQAMIPKLEIQHDDTKAVIEKDPYYTKAYNVTTYDSYLWTLYICPLAEIRREHFHSDIGLLLTTTGLITLDEIHVVLATEAMPSGELKEEYDKLLTITKFTLRILKEAGAHALVLSATIPAAMLSWILRGDLSARACVCVAGGQHALAYYRGRLKYAGATFKEFPLYDYAPQAEEYLKNVLTKISASDMLGDIRDAARKGASSILVICNTVSRAVRVYRKLSECKESDPHLKHYELILIHGRIIEEDKKARLETLERLLKNQEDVICIATQAIEAGVDLDFDALVTEIAPPASLIQRAGRVSRDLRNPHRGCIIINVSNSSVDSACKVYPGTLIERTSCALSQLLHPTWSPFDWRYGMTAHSYIRLLEEVYDRCFRPPKEYHYVGALKELVRRWPLLQQGREQLLQTLDRNFQGALIRESMLIPLYIPELDAQLATSLSYIATSGGKILETREGQLIACYEDGDIEEIPLRSLRDKPCRTMIRLLTKGKRFLGFRCKQGAYDPEVGLP